MAELSHKLNLLERNRDVCHGVDIALPSIVVVGEQSAGKSSLLESISGIQFPRAQNTCTRMPCILTLVTNPSIRDAKAAVSMHADFRQAEECSVQDVEMKIKDYTEQNRQGMAITDKPLYVKVVRNSGPQLSLIDLPGVTHNSSEMENIHDVTKGLVEKYIKPKEAVILCVIPATSDFGNAEVIKLAGKYDCEGARTIGVVTKCDDADKAESSDIVDKVLMKRKGDVKLKLGFHCVINRSQKEIDSKSTTQEMLRQKERDLFTQSHRLKAIPPEKWGTEQLTEKIAKIQARRVDECLPSIKESLREKMDELETALCKLPPQLSTQADQQRHLNNVLRQVSQDLQRRVKAEFVSSDENDAQFTIAPKIASLIKAFREELLKKSPKWLHTDQIKEVEKSVEIFASGYTVENLVGSQIFISLIRRTFIDSGLLREATEDMLEKSASHLLSVVAHVVAAHSQSNLVLSTRLEDLAEEAIEQQHSFTKDICKTIAKAQGVTSTTHGSYMVRLTDFRSTWLRAFQGDAPTRQEAQELTPEFEEMVQKAQGDPSKFAVLEICASLYVYSTILIEDYVEIISKIAKDNLMEELAVKLEDRWRDGTHGCLSELFPGDEEAAGKREEITATLDQLRDFQAQLAKLKVSSAAGGAARGFLRRARS